MCTPCSQISRFSTWANPPTSEARPARSAFHLRPLQHDPCLPGLAQLIVMRSLPVARNHGLGLRLLHPLIVPRPHYCFQMAAEVMHLKDEVETPVPHVWRDTLAAIVHSLVRGDVRIGEGIEDVDPLSEDVSNQCRENVADYGSATLIRLPEVAWDTSDRVSRLNHWGCLVDLWTAEEGRSDLVLQVAVSEDEGTAFRFRPYFVYAP